MYGDACRGVGAFCRYSRDCCHGLTCYARFMGHRCLDPGLAFAFNYRHRYGHG